MERLEGPDRTRWGRSAAPRLRRGRGGCAEFSTSTSGDGLSGSWSIAPSDRGSRRPRWPVRGRRLSSRREIPRFSTAHGRSWSALGAGSASRAGRSNAPRPASAVSVPTRRPGATRTGRPRSVPGDAPSGRGVRCGPARGPGSPPVRRCPAGPAVRRETAIRRRSSGDGSAARRKHAPDVDRACELPYVGRDGPAGARARHRSSRQRAAADGSGRCERGPAPASTGFRRSRSWSPVRRRREVWRSAARWSRRPVSSAARVSRHRRNGRRRRASSPARTRARPSTVSAAWTVATAPDPVAGRSRIRAA